ncbi:Ig-like domain-containing protein, partial [Parapedobacter indicus]
MTKYFLCIAWIACHMLSVNRASAQAFTENFDDITTLAGNGWLTQNNSSPVGSLNWFQGTSTTATPTPGPFNAYNGAANAYIAANFNSTTGGSGIISNWLLTPNRTFRNGDVLTFYTRKPTIGPGQTDYPDRLEVRLSTNGASTNVGAAGSNVGDFTTLLLSVNPTLVANVYPQIWTQYTITVSGLPAPTSGRVAFRYFVTSAGPSGSNSDYIGIDHVVYTPYVCPAFTVSGTVSEAIEGLPYSTTLAQTGALGPPSFAITAGALPDGLTLSSGGTIAGTPEESGTFNFTVTVSDASGCSGTESFSLVVEKIPSATITVANTDLSLNETASVTITFSEAVTGFDNDDLTVDNGTLSPVISTDGGITWTATLTPDPDVEVATNVIRLDNTGVVNVEDNAGMGTTTSNNYTIDTARPTSTITVSNTEVLTGETTGITITFSEAVTGFDNSDLTVANGTLGAVTSTDGGITWTATFTPAGDTYEPENVITLDLTGVSDAAGNAGEGTAGSNNYIVRTQALTLLVSSLLDTGDDRTTAGSWADDEADGGGLSLREALHWARPGDAITFAQGGTVTLDGTQLSVSRSNLRIDGDLDDDGVPDVTLSGNNATRIIWVSSGRTGVELEGLVLTGGAGTGGGGGVAFDINTQATLRNCAVTDNHELGWGGGGIYGSTTTLILVNCAVIGNSSDSFGGGVRLVGSSMLHMVNTTVSGNTTTGTGGHGGGIQYAGPGLLMINSTVSGNAALGSSSIGGGLRISSGAATVYNSTIVGNAASDNAGGVSANGTNDVFVNTVVAGNTAGAGATAGAGGSPLATGGTPDDVGGTIEAATNSYFGTSAVITSDNSSLNGQGTDNLLLGDLADNGGPVQTHRPQAGSALVDAGDTGGLPPDTYDLNGNTDVAEPLPLDATGAARVAGNSVDIGAVEGNRAPALADLDGGNTFIEGGDAIAIDNDVTVTDGELDALNGGNGNYSGASFTVQRTGGAVADDVFGFVDGSGLAVSSGQLVKSGQVIGAFDTSVDGRLTVTFTDAGGGIPTTPDINAMMQQVTYLNASNDPPTDITLDWTFADEAGAAVMGTASVAIGLRNDPPVLTATGADPTFTENGPAVVLFSGTSIDVVEAGQPVSGLELTVANAANGAEEFLSIDGSQVALEDGHTVTTAGSGLDVSVSVSAGTATVTIGSTAGLSTADAAALVDGMTYGHTGENPGELSRIVTITGVTDDGGTANGGDDTGEPGVSARVTMVPVNDAPAISGTPATVVDQDVAYSFVPAVSDVDNGPEDLTFAIVNKPDWADFDPATGELSGIPGNSDVGTTTGITITVSDGTESVDLAAFDLEVVNVNDAPTITGTPATSVDQDEMYSFIPAADDPDGDELAFSITNKPDWADFNTTTGELSGTPGNSDVGTTTGIMITVSDGTESVDLAAFDLEVVNVNDAPTIGGTPATSVDRGAAYSFMPVSRDIDGDDLLFSITNKPDWADFDTAMGGLSGTPDNGDVGITTGIVITVSDGELSASLPAFDLEVVHVNNAPTISGTPATTVDQGVAYSFIPAAEDLDGDELAFSITNKPDWADFDAATGGLSGTPGNGDVGVTAGIVVSVSDGTASASLAAFNLEVNSVVISGVTLPDGSFVYDGTAKSLGIVGGLPEGTSVSYQNNSRTDAGTQEVTATVSGGNYRDLVLTAVLTVTPAERTLAFPALEAKTYGDGEFDGGASASSGEGITYTSSNPAVAEITAAGQIRITGAGEATITATVPENGNYVNRPETRRTLVVGKATQTISFNAPAEVNRDAGTVQLDVTASSGLPVSLAIDDGQVATLSGTALNVLRLGTVTITATQAGDGNHGAAEPVTVTVRVVDPASDFAVRVHPAVSPNGDGINEFLMIEGIRDFPKNRVRVINRNGTVVWEASGYDNDRV